MTKTEALELVKAIGPLPETPIMQKADKSRCPCGTQVLLVCDKGIKFNPAYYVCPSCKRTVRIGHEPEEHGQKWFWCPRCKTAVPQLSPKHHKGHCPCIGVDKTTEGSPEAEMTLLSENDSRITPTLRRLERF